MAEQVTVPYRSSTSPVLAQLRLTVPAGRQQLVQFTATVVGKVDGSACTQAGQAQISIDGTPFGPMSGLLGPGEHEVVLRASSFGGCSANNGDPFTFTAAALALFDGGQSDVATPAP
jgi:hypothetical protein